MNWRIGSATSALLLTCILIACGGTSAPPPTNAPQSTNAPAQPTRANAVSTTVDRRAPTLAPTHTPTTVPATEIPPTATPLFPTIAATAAASLTRAPTTAPKTAAPNTATPNTNPAPGVYVTAITITPPQPKSKPAEFFFTLAFLNTVGDNVNYPRWRVLIFPKDSNKPLGDPEGTSKTIPNGASEQNTKAWSIKVQSACETFIAQPIWETEDGRQNAFAQPDGKSLTMEFQVCP